MGIGEGDEVITVPNTFIATAEAINQYGAKVVFVDIDQKTYTINRELVEKAITERTKAIIPFHMFGQMSDMDSIIEIARAHDLYVIEDACQAHGANYKGRRAGSIGDIGAFSFYPGKNLGAYGEAVAVVTNNEDLDKIIRMLRDHDQVKKYQHKIIGWNARMDGIQAAVLSVKLSHLEEWNKERKMRAKLYNKLLRGTEGIEIPIEATYSDHIYHIYAVRIQNRNIILNKLKAKNIQCSVHYPVPIHLQHAYKKLGYKRGMFSITEKCSDELLSLPIYPELGFEQIDYVASELKKLV